MLKYKNLSYKTNTSKCQESIAFLTKHLTWSQIKYVFQHRSHILLYVFKHQNRHLRGCWQVTSKLVYYIKILLPVSLSENFSYFVIIESLRSNISDTRYVFETTLKQYSGPITQLIQFRSVLDTYWIVLFNCSFKVSKVCQHL